MSRFSKRPSLTLPKSHADKLRENDAALAMWSAVSGKPTPEHWKNNVAPKREIVNHSPASELEGAVSSEVRELLSVHPQILFAYRQNGGKADYEKEGKLIPVWFYRFVRARGDLRLTDYIGFLTTGQPFAIECKRRSWNPEKKLDVKEEAQLRYMMLIRKVCKGKAGFVRSSAEAQAIIESV